MSPDGPWFYVILVILLVLSAFFSGAETAFSSCNIIRMRVKADDGSKTAKMVCKLDDKSNKTLITILIGNNIVNIIFSIMALNMFESFYNTNLDLAAVLSTIVATAVVYIFGETTPKSFARANADGFAKFSAPIVLVLYYVLTPISIIFEGLNILLSKIFKIKEEPLMTEDDFTNVIEEIEDQGILEENESDIIQSALDFDDTPCKDVLTPRDKIFALSINDLTHEKLKEILKTVKYSRIPIYEGDIDHIIGILHVRKYLKDHLTRPEDDIRKSLMFVYFVSSKETLENIFDGFKKNRTHVAIVQNQNGQTVGMVTMDDVLEELVGEVEQHPTNNPSSVKGGAN